LTSGKGLPAGSARGAAGGDGDRRARFGHAIPCTTVVPIRRATASSILGRYMRAAGRDETQRRQIVPLDLGRWASIFMMAA